MSEPTTEGMLLENRLATQIAHSTDASPFDQAQLAIVDECSALAAMLIQKNRAYGNSALDPLRIFSKADPVEQILVRLDDKLSRLKRGSAAGEDVEKDILGYLILLRIARRQK